MNRLQVLPELDRKRREYVFILLILGTSVTLAHGYLAAKQGRLVNTYLLALLTWTGYLAAHYVSEGTFADGKFEALLLRPIAPHTPKKISGGLLGASILITGMIIGVYGIRSTDPVTTTVAAVLFLGGYVVAHLSITGEPL